MRTYSSKLLLFGEYAIINGGNGLALPLNAFSAQWSHYNIYSVDSEKSRQSLYQLYSYILEHPTLSLLCNCKKLKADLDKGFWISSNIPQGYGLGSSGAISAAIYDTYFEKDSDLSIVKAHLASIECCFHGKSSGLDPIVSYTNSCILVEDNIPKPIEHYIKGDFDIYLLDTKLARNSTPLIAQYLEKSQNEDFAKALYDYKNYNDACIAAFLKGDKKALQEKLYNLSLWQWQYFDFLIPKPCKADWENALRDKSYIFKICGAGGGGYMLVFDFERKETFEQLKTIVPLQKIF